MELLYFIDKNIIAPFILIIIFYNKKSLSSLNRDERHSFRGTTLVNHKTCDSLAGV